MVSANVGIQKLVDDKKISKMTKLLKILCITTKNEIVKNLLTVRNSQIFPKGIKIKATNRKMIINLLAKE